MNSSMLILASAARAANSTTYLSHSDSGHGNVLACVLSFLAAAISSAAGVGGGSLYFAILSTGAAGLSVKTATVFSRFMVTAVSLSNVLYTVFFLREPAGAGGEPLIDYDVVVVSQPCLLLGVSVRVLCNVVFPEWLVTALFAAFLAFATFVTYRTGVRRWRAETVAMRRIAEDGGDDVDGNRQVLLGRRAGGSRRRCHWMDMAVLVLVWLFFFLVHLLVGGRGAKVWESHDADSVLLTANSKEEKKSL